MKFHDILASLIHDMKNSLSMVINTLEEITADEELGKSKKKKIQMLQQEAKRLNNNLIELLTLYKIENERVSANIDEVYLPDFLAELVAESRVEADSRGVDLSWACDDDLSGYFDEGLVRGVINTVIGNGLRYTDSQLLISAEMDKGYLVIRVEDDGSGYPADMIEAQAAADNHDQVLEGRTQLGLFFATMVANMHKNKLKEGFIRLQNNHRLTGGCFSLFLP